MQVHWAAHSSVGGEKKNVLQQPRWKPSTGMSSKDLKQSYWMSASSPLRPIVKWGYMWPYRWCMSQLSQSLVLETTVILNPQPISPIKCHLRGNVAFVATAVPLQCRLGGLSVVYPGLLGTVVVCRYHYGQWKRHEHLYNKAINGVLNISHSKSISPAGSVWESISKG